MAGKTGNVANATEGHPTRLEPFYRKNPSFIWGPLFVSGLVYGITKIPRVAHVLTSKRMEPWGATNAATYTAFAIVLSYAFHGWCVTHAPHRLKIQGAKVYEVSPSAMAVRSTAAIATSMVYSFLPLAPESTSWIQFATWAAVLAVYWDFHFYVCHRLAHEQSWCYTTFHKTHHLCKHPNCFGAYFVTYQSHIVLEQVVVFICAAMGLPKDVFVFTLYWGTLGTFLEHGGYELGTVKLPFVPFTFGQLCSVVSVSTFFLESVNSAEHDWHHEKFTTNYSLSFRYLDKLFGTYHPGRIPGSKELTKKLVNATYTELRQATIEDFISQGKAFDAYAESGRIVDNVLAFVTNMKGVNGEIGAAVDMYTHSVQTATRARRDGCDDETIVCALLHDIGEVLSGTNHGEIPAALLRPYVSPKNHWVLANHEVFQAYFYLDKCGGDKDLRDKCVEYKEQGIVPGHPYYDACAKFCELYDQPSFDPDYQLDSLESFRPLVEKVLKKQPFWWETKSGEQRDCKARLAAGYSLKARAQ